MTFPDEQSSGTARGTERLWPDPVPLDQLGVDLYLDSAHLETLARLGQDPRVKGFTTNPTLMLAGGVKDYRDFVAQALEIAAGRPISFPVLADDLKELEQQARVIGGWGNNVSVKIPVTTSRGEATADVQRRLGADNISINVTAVMTLEQVAEAVSAVAGNESLTIISVFAGRVADTGRDPRPLMRAARDLVNTAPTCRLLWGSTRESYNVVQAAESGSHIITLSSALWAKSAMVAMDLALLSRETVSTFHESSREGGYTVDPLLTSAGRPS
jgi:transaldolase